MGLWTEAWGNPWEALVLEPLQSWLAEHPIAGWLVLHPLGLLGLLVVGLLLFAGLWSAIARLTEGFWLALVGFPFRLSGWLWGTVAGGLIHHWRQTPPPGDRLGEILVRLESLHQEQTTLLNELHALLKQK